MADKNPGVFWPDVSGDFDRASFCGRLVRGQSSISPFVERGRLVFVTDSPEMFATVLQSRPEIYTTPANRYKQAAHLYHPTGRFLLGLDAQRGAAQQIVPKIVRTLAVESVNATNDFVRRCNGGESLYLLSASRELILRCITKLLFTFDSAAWSKDWVGAAAFLEAWQILVGSRNNHAALQQFLAATEIKHRAAASIMQVSGPAPAGSPSHSDVRTGVIETIMTSTGSLSTILSWVLLELSERPRLRDALTAEIDAAVADGTRVDAPTISRLRETKQVVLECLRLHPGAWAVSRIATAEDELDGQMIPKGAHIWCSIYALHRNPTIWSSPNAWHPGRFDARGCPRAWRRGFLPFSMGAHACPAGPLVPLILQTVLAALIKEFDFDIERHEEVRNRTFITLMPHPEPKVHFNPRFT